MARKAKRSELEGFMIVQDGRKAFLTEFNESLWLELVHQMKVESEGEYTFMLKDGAT